MIDILGSTVTSSSLTARISSIPSSYGPSTPEFPPRSDIPTERTRSRNIFTDCVLIVPALVITNASNGIYFPLPQSDRQVRRKSREVTHKDIFPSTIIARKV